jgi:hypothetical protein
MHDPLITERLGTHPNTIHRIQQVLDTLDPISLAEMQHVSLQDRIDTKYLIGVSQLQTVLERIAGQYRVLDINHVRLNQYETLYFDTPNFTLYHDHHNRVGSRYKIRARKYVESNLVFFEIKHKTNQRRTIKSRIPIPDVTTQLKGQIDSFVDAYTPFDTHVLEPKLWNGYLRVTFVSKHLPERLTLDLNVEFLWGDTYHALSGVVIAEVKQAKFSRESDFIRQMRQLGIRPTSFSKYTAGVYCLYDHVKTNNFKAQTREVQKLMEKELRCDSSL